MPDISMCRNGNCTKRDTCYRYQARPSLIWQAYGTFKQDKEGNCDYYWENK